MAFEVARRVPAAVMAHEKNVVRQSENEIFLFVLLWFYRLRALRLIRARNSLCRNDILSQQTAQVGKKRKKYNWVSEQIGSFFAGACPISWVRDQIFRPCVLASVLCSRGSRWRLCSLWHVPWCQDIEFLRRQTAMRGNIIRFLSGSSEISVYQIPKRCFFTLELQ